MNMAVERLVIDMWMIESLSDVVAGVTFALEFDIPGLRFVELWGDG